MTAAVRALTLAWVAVAFLCGVAAADAWGPGALAAAGAISIALVAAAIITRERIAWLLAVLLPTTFLLGAWRFEASHGPLPDDAVSRSNDAAAVRLIGVVRDDAVFGASSQRFAIDVEQRYERDRWVPASGGVLIVAPPLPARRAGDVIEVEGALESPPALDSFDYPAYLARRGIASTIAFPRISARGTRPLPAWRAPLVRLRRAVAHGIERALPEPEASLAEGVLLGERSALPADVRADLNATNLSHLVVVSGSNVALVASMLASGCAWAFGRRRALVIALLGIVTYALIVGGSAPVVRASIMASLLVGARMSGRRSTAIVPITLAAAAIVFVSPDALRDPSFQLSFAATAGIAWLGAPLRVLILNACARLFRRETLPSVAWPLAENLAVTISATLAVNPLIAMYFGRTSLIGLPANLLVVPLFPFMLAASGLAPAAATVPWGGTLLAAPAHYLLSYWLAVARSLADAPAAAPGVRLDAPAAAAAYVALVSVTIVVTRAAAPARMADRLHAVGSPLSLARVGLVVVPLVVAAGSAAFLLSGRGNGELVVTVLDVGQGDAILIRTPRGHDVLVDGGPGRAVLRGLGEAMPWHDRTIDYVVLTHPQADHLNGLVDVLDRFEVRHVLSGPGRGDVFEMDVWDDAVTRSGASRAVAHAGQTLPLDDGIEIDVLAPDAVMAGDENLNNTGVVLRVSWRDVHILLTADIEAEAEAELLRSGADIRAGVLKVAHHGSRTSSTPAFLAAVRPAVAVISVGEGNRYGHPAPDVVERLATYADVYTTASHGSVRIATDGQRIWVNGGEVSQCTAC